MIFFYLVVPRLVQKEDTRSSGMKYYGMCGMLGLIARFHSRKFNDLTKDSFSLWNNHFPSLFHLTSNAITQGIHDKMFKWMLLQFK